VDHGEQRLLELQQGTDGAHARQVVVGGRAASAAALELRDVGPRHEGGLARATQDDDAHLVVPREFLHRLWHRAPHVDGDRVAPLRMVEDDPSDAALRFHPDPATHGAQSIIAAEVYLPPAAHCRSD